jgi:hypothetical protein
VSACQQRDELALARAVLACPGLSRLKLLCCMLYRSSCASVVHSGWVLTQPSRSHHLIAVPLRTAAHRLQNSWVLLPGHNSSLAAMQPPSTRQEACDSLPVESSRCMRVSPAYPLCCNPGRKSCLHARHNFVLSSWNSRLTCRRDIAAPEGQTGQRCRAQQNVACDTNSRGGLLRLCTAEAVDCVAGATTLHLRPRQTDVAAHHQACRLCRAVIKWWCTAGAVGG